MEKNNAKPRNRIKELSDIHNSNYEPSKKDSENKGLSAFHLAGLGIGGILGAGYFLGCGLAVHEAGPSVSLAYLLGGVIMIQVLGSMVSINVNRLAHGSFRVYTEEFLGPYFGFLLGWIVFISGVFTICSESLAMATFIKYWLPSIPLPITALIFVSLIIIINLFNMENFGRIEGLMSALKIFALVLFIVIGIYVLIPNMSFKATNIPYIVNNFFPKGISGFLQSMLIVIFCYSGISAIAMASSEAKKPRITIPKATTYMSFGIIFVYILSMIVLTSLISWKTVYINQSPFVQAFHKIGLGWAASSMNIIILLAAFSVMAASYYACIQMIVSLADSKEAPSFLKVTSKKGLYKNAWLTVGIVSLALVALSFIVSQKLFSYLIAASSYFTFINWITNLVTYIVWLKVRDPKETYESHLVSGKIGAITTIIIIAFMFIMSLRVPDFRMGFYSAAAIFLLISASYMFIANSHNREKSY
jgi:L-asparagine transporter-like permease